MLDRHPIGPGSRNQSAATSRIETMSVNVDLPAESLRRLEAEAARRGLSIDQVIAELADQLPADGPRRNRRLGFVGIGASGDTRPLDIHRERAELADKKLADGI